MPSRRTFFKALANGQEAMDDKVSSVVYLFNCVNNFENNFLFFSNSTALATSFPDALFTVYKQTGQSSHYLVLACVPLFSCLSVSAFYLCKLSPQWAYNIPTCRACDVPVNSQWPRVSGGRGSRVEQSAGRCHFVAIAVDIQETAEDRTVCSELSIALATSDTLLFTARAAHTSFRFCLFCFIRCPSIMQP